jgi:serine/threonine protein kinase
LSRGQALDVYAVFSADRLCSATAKTIRPDRAGVERVRHRLLLEGRLLTTIAHPHLLRGFEVVEDPVPVVVVETLMGYDLDEIVAWRRRRLPSTDLAHLGRQLASALQYLHACGYLHLDVRPANVMAHGGKATLIDLSIARQPGEVSSGFGTPEYMAPEQSRGGLMSAATDAWGLGATLYAAATGVPPNPSVGPVRSLRPRLHPALAEVVDACLSSAPEDRPGMLEIHRRLGSVVG